jgi:hypothetical protein
VLERAALHAREERPVERLRVLLAAISRKRSASIVRGYAEPPQTISFGRTSFACARISS